MIPSVDDILQKRQVYSDYWAPAHTRYDELLTAYHGDYQKLWPEEFRRGEVPKIANWIKLGWDRYATMAGKVPTNHVKTANMRRRSQTAADKVEKVLAHYDHSSGMASLMKWYAWYLVGFGSSVMGVMPDGVLKGPRYFIKDPRAVLPTPGAGSVATTSSAYGMLSKPIMSTMSLQEVIFNETVTTSYLYDTFRDDPEKIRSMVDGENLSTPQQMITYMDKDHIRILVNDRVIHDAEHGLGFVPVRYTSMFVPDQLGGQSQFEQNIGLVLAYMRILNQKLTYNQNVVWPWLVIRGLNNMDPQRRVIELMDRDGAAEFLAPPGEIQIERDLDTLDRLIRVMNHDTEAMQGEAPGSIVTGRSIIELNRDVRTMVANYWEVMKPDLEFLKAAALMIDENLYGGVEKTMYGRSKGELFEDTYTPREAINGNYAVEVDFGIGVGGFDGFVELMQFAAQGYADEQTVMEHAPWIRSVSETRRKVLMDRLEKLLLDAVANQLPPPIINHLSMWHKEVEKGKDPWKWIAANPFPMPLPEELGGAPGMPAPPGAPGGEQPPGAPPGMAQAQAPSPQNILQQFLGGQ